MGGYGGYSGYGGVGGYGGYGGYGGLGGYSSYGGYPSYGMYGGYGGQGMQGQNPMMEKGMRFLESFGFITHSLCEVARNIEMNAEGLSRLWISLKGLGYKLTIGLFLNIVDWIIWLKK